MGRATNSGRDPLWGGAVCFSHPCGGIGITPYVTSKETRRIGASHPGSSGLQVMKQGPDLSFRGPPLFRGGGGHRTSCRVKASAGRNVSVSEGGGVSSLLMLQAKHQLRGPPLHVRGSILSGSDGSLCLFDALAAVGTRTRRCKKPRGGFWSSWQGVWLLSGPKSLRGPGRGPTGSPSTVVNVAISGARVLRFLPQFATHQLRELEPLCASISSLAK